MSIAIPRRFTQLIKRTGCSTIFTHHSRPSSYLAYNQVPVTTTALIAPTSREGFQSLLRRPSDALIPFLNTILGSRLEAPITSIDDTVQVIRSAPVISTTNKNNQPESIQQSLQQEWRISDLQSHHPKSSPSEDPDHQNKSEHSDTICYTLVAKTEESEPIDVEIQVASRTFDQNEPAASGARMVSSHGSYMKMNRGQSLFTYS